MEKPAKQYARRNIVLKIEYDGLEFFGWQRQPGQPTVQAAIEDLLTGLLGKKTVVYGAGRTDSGVSAKGQVANFWGDSRFEEQQWARVLNFSLPKTIRIVESRIMDDTFHAQKCALGKRYEYSILNRGFQSALNRHVYFYPYRIDWNRVREAMAYFVGTHDFVSFQGAKATVLSTVRTIHRFELFQENDGIVRFEIEGTGFLKQMVRAVIGTVMEVGEGKREPHEIPYIIRARDRRQAGRTVPAVGLCLAHVDYPAHFVLWQTPQLGTKILPTSQQIFVPELEPDGYTVN